MTIEITIYQQKEKLYCQDCKPHGSSHKGTLVLSSYDHCCHGCGHDLKEMALLALNEQQAAQDWQAEEFYSLMAEAQ